VDDGLHFRAALFQQGGEAGDDQAVLLRFQLVDHADYARIERLAWLDVLDGGLDQFGAFGIESFDGLAQIVGVGFFWLRDSAGLRSVRRWGGSIGSGGFLVEGERRASFRWRWS
jgi:hypothetical protein